MCGFTHARKAPEVNDQAFALSGFKVRNVHCGKVSYVMKLLVRPFWWSPDERRPQRMKFGESE